jgi:transcriptional regulator with XRE-family HTH domain
MHIGKKIKDLRQEKRMSQAELANRAGYKSGHSIFKLEQKKNFTYRVVKKLANALEVDVSIFYDEVQDASFEIDTKKDEIALLLERIKEICSHVREENTRLRSINEELRRQISKNH